MNSNNNMCEFWTYFLLPFYSNNLRSAAASNVKFGTQIGEKRAVKFLLYSFVWHFVVMSKKFMV